MDSPLHTVVETNAYLARASKVLTEEKRQLALWMVATNPECGDIIRGTGGVRKVQLALQGRGKSGGARIIYFYHDEGMPIFMLTVFAKNQKANISGAETVELAKLTRRLVDTYRRKP